VYRERITTTPTAAPNFLRRRGALAFLMSMASDLNRVSSSALSGESRSVVRSFDVESLKPL